MYFISEVFGSSVRILMMIYLCHFKHNRIGNRGGNFAELGSRELNTMAVQNLVKMSRPISPKIDDNLLIYSNTHMSIMSLSIMFSGSARAFTSTTESTLCERLYTGTVCYHCTSIPKHSMVGCPVCK